MNLPFITFSHNFSPASNESQVNATFYLDVKDIIGNSALIDKLKKAVVNDTLGMFEVDTATFEAIHRIVGKFGLLRF